MSEVKAFRLLKHGSLDLLLFAVVILVLPVCLEILVLNYGFLLPASIVYSIAIIFPLLRRRSLRLNAPKKPSYSLHFGILITSTIVEVLRYLDPDWYFFPCSSTPTGIILTCSLISIVHTYSLVSLRTFLFESLVLQFIAGVGETSTYQIMSSVATCVLVTVMDLILESTLFWVLWRANFILLPSKSGMDVFYILRILFQILRTLCEGIIALSTDSILIICAFELFANAGYLIATQTSLEGSLIIYN
ncbi:hypothetical protein ADUPG1_008707 [Aduncisulcus paluster]|uniref:Uncharacterized protein n=1 Tax=Aduncisulcus paluster TaxID=2918883 RepID=A0ABQ5KSY2_9EUKA|nr:hypothetical protein ADUPG1_008707 [Aduncisulcus paluster]